MKSQRTGIEDPTGTITNMKLHILSTASSLMTEKGIKETSLKDIARKAGISQGTLYYYYAAKEDIIFDIADQNLQQIADGLLAWIDDDRELSPVQILKIVFEKILNTETRGRLHLYLVSDAGANNSVLAEKFKQRYTEWREALEYGLHKKLPHNAEHNKALSFLLLAILDGLSIQKILGVEGMPIEEMARLVLRTQEPAADQGDEMSPPQGACDGCV